MLYVALRKESVDRNSGLMSVVRFASASLSARRAWIEIPHTSRDFPAPKVALRKESVDRNINCDSNFTQKKHVALRKESVDRNARLWACLCLAPSVALRKESVDRNGGQECQ